MELVRELCAVAVPLLAFCAQVGFCFAELLVNLVSIASYLLSQLNVVVIDGQDHLAGLLLLVHHLQGEVIVVVVAVNAQ